MLLSKFLSCTLLVGLAWTLCVVSGDLTPRSRHLISEVGESAWEFNTTPCDPTIIGSTTACYNQNIQAVGNYDYPWGNASIAYPTDGTPWGVHLTGPNPDGVTYILSWFTGNATVGPNVTQINTTSMTCSVKLTYKKGTKTYTTFSYGKVITYVRSYTTVAASQFNYLSPYISHVVLSNLVPDTTYSYQVTTLGGVYYGDYSFKTLPRKKTYPLRVGVMGDIGQTVNSSDTRDHIYANDPQVILMVGDNSYADDYSYNNPDSATASGTNQLRWDSYAVLWQKVFSKTPVLNLIGNHETETSLINATLNYTTNSGFGYPYNYPFQTYTNRYPSPTLNLSSIGDINQNLYYSTIVGGAIKLIVMNNYVPFHPGSAQYQFVTGELQAFNRKQTPWLIVMYHTATYHTYYTHYKELECFRGIWEPLFYKYRVDFVLNGHVHAYERTHPMFNYQPNTCGPMYFTIGDGGNIEGPYRNFVDEINPNTNLTFCEMLHYGAYYPNNITYTNWGPSYAEVANPPNCNTLSWQPANGVKGGPVLVPNANATNVGFCQSSQPVWSAHRDPSFGHGIFEFLSDTEVTFNWYKNVNGNSQPADSVLLQRSTACRLVSHSA